MAKKITIQLSEKSIGDAIKQLNAYKRELPKKLNELCRRLADMGAVNVSLGYTRAIYTGPKDISVDVMPTDNGYAIVANGEKLLFVEFGSGITYGDGHPQAQEFGYGPGTWPGDEDNPRKGHWDDPRGWYLPKKAGGGHTYGNPPNPVMYQTAQELQNEVLRIAREVFQ